MILSLQISIPNECTVADWHDRIIMEHLFKLHLKRTVGGSIEWYQIFQS
jgi:hypothetical protein